MGLFGNRSTLDRRLKRVRRELTSVSSNLESLEKTVARADGEKRASVLQTPAPPGGRHDERGRTGGKDPRFADYLSSSLQPMRPLRRERRVQRNKAIVMSIFVLLVLFWIVWRLFL